MQVLYILACTACDLAFHHVPTVSAVLLYLLGASEEVWVIYISSEEKFVISCTYYCSHYAVHCISLVNQFQFVGKHRK